MEEKIVGRKWTVRKGTRELEPGTLMEFLERVRSLEVEDHRKVVEEGEAIAWLE